MSCQDNGHVPWGLLVMGATIASNLPNLPGQQATLPPVSSPTADIMESRKHPHEQQCCDAPDDENVRLHLLELDEEQQRQHDEQLLQQHEYDKQHQSEQVQQSQHEEQLDQQNTKQHEKPRLLDIIRGTLHRCADEFAQRISSLLVQLQYGLITTSTFYRGGMTHGDEDLKECTDHQAISPTQNQFIQRLRNQSLDIQTFLNVQGTVEQEPIQFTQRLPAAIQNQNLQLSRNQKRNRDSLYGYYGNSAGSKQSWSTGEKSQLTNWLKSTTESVADFCHQPQVSWSNPRSVLVC